MWCLNIFQATSALDTKTERAIQKCLEELCSTRTGVVCFEDPNLDSFVNSGRGASTLHRSLVRSDSRPRQGNHHWKGKVGLSFSYLDFIKVLQQWNVIF